MHANARERLETLVKEAEPRTVKARIRALAPLIKAARGKGITWGAIREALGVRHSTLTSAMRGYEIPTASAASPPADKQPRGGRKGTP